MCVCVCVCLCVSVCVCVCLCLCVCVWYSAQPAFSQLRSSSLIALHAFVYIHGPSGGLVFFLLLPKGDLECPVLPTHTRIVFNRSDFLPFIAPIGRHCFFSLPAHSHGSKRGARECARISSTRVNAGKARANASINKILILLPVSSLRFLVGAAFVTSLFWFLCFWEAFRSGLHCIRMVPIND